ncbi:MAG: hypothetical protein M3N23_13125 [Pseudomonadota bacterium]|nr:hypothetical protein [Pseudomonadota bacterium]
MKNVLAPFAAVSAGMLLAAVATVTFSGQPRASTVTVLPPVVVTAHHVAVQSLGSVTVTAKRLHADPVTRVAALISRVVTS